MSIATFSPPFKAVDEGNSLPVIVIAVEMLDDRAKHGTISRHAHVIDGDGNWQVLPLDRVLVDWRYNPQTEKWGSFSEPDAEIDV